MPEVNPPDRLPGIEIAEAAGRLGGRTSLLLELLQDFAHTHADTAQVIRGQLGVDAFADAAREAHSVKGVAASCGCTRVAAAAREIEKQARDESVDDDALHEFEAALQEVAVSAARLQISEPVSAVFRGSTTELSQPALEEFLQRLRNRDFAVATQFEALKPALMQRFAGLDMPALCAAIKSYDHASALKIIEAQISPE